MISPINVRLYQKPKVTGLEMNSRCIFLTKSPGQQKRTQKAETIFNFTRIKEEKNFLIIDETGDKKEKKRTDYVNRQYLGKLGKI